MIRKNALYEIVMLSFLLVILTADVIAAEDPAEDPAEGSKGSTDLAFNIGLILILLVVIGGGLYYLLGKKNLSTLGFARDSKSKESVSNVQMQMLEIEVNSFIDDAIGKGFTKDQIKENLLKQGRPADMIDRQLARFP